MSAENAWRIAREAAAEWLSALHGRPGQKDADAHDAAVREAQQLLRSLPMPPAFRAAVEAETEELREGLRNIAVVGFSDDPKVNAAIARQCVEQARALLSRLEAKGENHE